MSGRLRRTYKKWFWNTYDYIGTLIVVNVLWVLCALPVITLPASMAGLLCVTARITANQDVTVRDFFVGVRIYFWRTVCLCGIYAVSLVVLVVNIIFYMRMMEQWPWAGAILSGGMIWVAAFVSLTGIVTFPLLAQADEPVRIIIGKGVLLVLDNIWFVGVILMSGLAILTLGAVTGAGLVFVAISATSVLCSTCVRELQKKYTPPSMEQDIRDGTLPVESDEDFEESRGWRDLFRPWDYR